MGNVHTAGSLECFFVATFNFPKYASDSAWGRAKEEMSSESWKALNSSVFVSQDVQVVLRMVVQMIWKHDLGFKFLPSDEDEDGYEYDYVLDG